MWKRLRLRGRHRIVPCSLGKLPAIQADRWARGPSAASPPTSPADVSELLLPWGRGPNSESLGEPGESHLCKPEEAQNKGLLSRDWPCRTGLWSDGFPGSPESGLAEAPAPRSWGRGSRSAGGQRPFPGRMDSVPRWSPTWVSGCITPGPRIYLSKQQQSSSPYRWAARGWGPFLLSQYLRALS